MKTFVNDIIDVAGIPIKVFSLICIPSDNETTFVHQSEVFVSEDYQYPTGTS